MQPVLTEVRVLHGLCCRQPLLVVVAQQLIQQVQGLRAHQVLVLRLDELLPALPRLSAHTATSTWNRNRLCEFRHAATGLAIAGSTKGFIQVVDFLLGSDDKIVRSKIPTCRLADTHCPSRSLKRVSSSIWYLCR